MQTSGKFQYVKSATSTTPSFLDYNQFMGLIRTSFVRDVVRNARAALAEGNEQRYQEIKRGLPAMMWCGVSEDGKQRAARYLQPTGLFMVDVDHCGSREKVEECFARVRAEIDSDMEYAGRLMAAHVTPSGEGLRLVVLASGIYDNIADEMQHFISRFPLLGEYGHVDEAVKDYSRLSFLVSENDFFMLPQEGLFGKKMESPLTPANANANANANPNANVNANPNANANAKEPEAYAEIRKTYRYNDALVAEIAERYVEKKGEPQVGERHEFYNGMVKNFRNICDNNPQVLHAVLPRFGKPFDETLKQCEFMCRSNTTTSKSKDFYLFLVSEGYIKRKKAAVTESEVKAELETDRDEDTKESQVDYLKELGVVPPVFREFLNICPNEFVYPTITALLPIMGTLTSYLRARYLDGAEHTTSFYSVVYAPPGSGKSFIERLSTPLFRLLRKRDELNSLRESIYLEEEESRAEGEKPQKNPRASVRIFPAINSQTEFLTKMRDNKGFHMFTCAEEVDTFNKGTKAAGGDKSDLFRIAWDNGNYGQSFKGKNSFKGTVRLYYNVLLTGTLGQVKNYYKNVENGMVTRVSFSEIANQSFAEAPEWKTLQKKAQEVIGKFVERCDFNTYSNRIDDVDFDEIEDMESEVFVKEVPWRSQFKERQRVNMSWLFPSLKKWLEKNRVAAMKDMDYARDTFRRRTAVKGFRLAMICTQCWTEFKEKQQQIVEDFVLKWMDYDLEQALSLFGAQFNENIEKNVEIVRKTGFDSVFSSLPYVFTQGDVRVRLQQEGKKTPPRIVVCLWKKQHLITCSLDESNSKIYTKTARNDGKRNK